MTCNSTAAINFYRMRSQWRVRCRRLSGGKSQWYSVIYANDNFGRWRSDFPAIVEQFLKPNVRRRPLGKELEEAKHKRSRKAG
jgi:hypothetical protein